MKLTMIALHRDESAITWGSWPEWATAFVALAALAAAFASAAYSRNQARYAQKAFDADAKVREEAQARKVYAVVQGRLVRRQGGRLRYRHDVVYDRGIVTKDDRLTVDALVFRFKIYNNSDEVIGPVAYWVEDHDEYEDFFEGPIFRTDPTTLLPRTEREVAAVVPLPKGWRDAGAPTKHLLLGLKPSIEFTDSVGQSWWRVAAEPVAKIDHTPGYNHARPTGDGDGAVL